MLYFAKWKVATILAICFLGLVYAAPNFVAGRSLEGLPAWLPVQKINLGLDLQGGSHLLLEVEVDAVVRDRVQAMEGVVRTALRPANVGYTDLGARGRVVTFNLREPGRADEVRRLIRAEDSAAEVTVDANGLVTVSMQEAEEQRIRDSAVQQSIEIVRRRIDETGTREPTIQRQGESRIIVQLPGVDDPERIKALLGETAKMDFHLADTTVTPTDARAGRLPAGSVLLPGVTSQGEMTEYVVRRRPIVGGEHLVDAQPSFQDGQPVVRFRFDTQGARRFGRATQENVGRPLAIVLDNKVISAPVIREPILGGEGIISGSFTVQGAQDLSLLLRAGALPAPLKILEERTVGPGLGQDSIDAGKTASIIGMILVVVFMVVAYGLFGLMADIALLLNMSLIVASLSVLQATLTLPGIAGIVLTIGMAVDANVLIFERIREEIRLGRTPISAVDAGYKRALTTIIDANLTTLIAAVLLYIFGSGPVRGFAVTLAIGLVTSMFTAIWVTRLMVVTWLRRRRPQALPI
ncbi:MAG: protein translocase subunit SecD [Alphaproteobacteria bacterium]